MTLDLDPALEARLRAEALARGVSVETLLLESLEHRLGERRVTAQLDADETALLETINHGFPEAFWIRYRQLIAQREHHTLSDLERAELTAMSDEAELRSAQRAQALAALAELRRVGVHALIQELGLQPTSLTA